MSYEKIKISGLAEMEWLKVRKSGIGGSDVGAILGLNKYSSPMKVYKEKTTDETEDGGRVRDKDKRRSKYSK